MFTQASSMLQAIIIFIECQVVAVLFALVGGSAIDVFYNNMVNTGLMDISGEFGNFSTVNLLIGIFYIICVSTCLYGIFILGLTIYHQYILDDGEEEESGDQIYTGDDY